jgi:hypothetical protein
MWPSLSQRLRKVLPLCRPRRSVQDGRLILLVVLIATLTNLESRLMAVPVKQMALLNPGQVNEQKLVEIRKAGFTSIALTLTETNGALRAAAVEAVRRAGLDLDYWIEIGRNSALADAHPEWMASIQTHKEWRRFFPQFPATPSNAVVKAYPWVPALYRETFDVHLQRVKQLLADRPAPVHLFLNDLQAAPSACGCGHPLCRWTPDYGPLTSATRLGNDAAAQFVQSVKHIRPETDVIPVWTTECEEHDREGLCAGVGCFRGNCWQEWTAQLDPLAAENITIGVLLLYRAFDRDLPIYHQPAGWIAAALESFQKMPLRYQPEGVPARRLLAVLQGWDVTPEQVQAQIARATEAGAAGVLVAFTAIDQSWSPRLFTLPATNRAQAR